MVVDAAEVHVGRQQALEGARVEDPAASGVQREILGGTPEERSNHVEGAPPVDANDVLQGESCPGAARREREPGQGRSEGEKVPESYSTRLREGRLAAEGRVLEERVS